MKLRLFLLVLFSVLFLSLSFAQVIVQEADDFQYECEARGYIWFTGDITGAPVWSYTNSEVGSNPPVFNYGSIYENPPDSEVSVIAGFQGRDKVAEIVHVADGGTCNPPAIADYVYYSFGKGKTVGTEVEFYVAGGDASRLYFTMQSGSACEGEFYTYMWLDFNFETGEIVNIHSGGSDIVYSELEPNKWYRVKTHGNSIYDFDLYLDYNKLGTYNTKGALSMVSSVIWRGKAGTTYVDHIDYSGESKKENAPCCGDDLENDNFETDVLTCLAGITKEKNCENGIDDDNDGFVDYLDSDCVENICNDGVDNDANGLIDCLDPNCSGIDNCQYETELTCTDDFDNDADGSIDCADTDCCGIGNCECVKELTCNDDFDNDADGSIDCADTDCENQACATGTCCSGSCVDINSDLSNCGSCGNACGSLEICTNGVCEPIDGDASLENCNLYNGYWTSQETREYTWDSFPRKSGYLDGELSDDDCDGSSLDGGCDKCSSGSWYNSPERCEIGCWAVNDIFTVDYDTSVYEIYWYGEGYMDCGCSHDIGYWIKIDGKEVESGETDPEWRNNKWWSGYSGVHYRTAPVYIPLTAGDHTLEVYREYGGCGGAYIHVLTLRTRQQACCGDDEIEEFFDLENFECIIGVLEEKNCENGIDDDADGSIDCADTDCCGIGNCECVKELTCNDDFDNDADGSIDCADVDDCPPGIPCGTGMACQSEQCFPTSEICNNNKDDNGNNLADCTDTDYCGDFVECSGCESGKCWCFSGSCIDNYESICNNDKDDDGDGYEDCEDPDCNKETCDTNKICLDGDCKTPPEDCNNKEDDDYDELIDCEDPDCACSAGYECKNYDCQIIPQEDCSNKMDDDFDGLIDCEDPDCACSAGYECKNYDCQIIKTCFSECETISSDAPCCAGLISSNNTCIMCEERKQASDCDGKDSCSEACGADHECDGVLLLTGNCGFNCNYVPPVITVEPDDSQSECKKHNFVWVENKCCGDDDGETWAFSQGLCYNEKPYYCGDKDGVCLLEYNIFCTVEDKDCTLPCLHLLPEQTAYIVENQPNALSIELVSECKQKFENVEIISSYLNLNRTIPLLEPHQREKIEVERSFSRGEHLIEIRATVDAKEKKFFLRILAIEPKKLEGKISKLLDETIIQLKTFEQNVETLGLLKEFSNNIVKINSNLEDAKDKLSKRNYMQAQTLVTGAIYALRSNSANLLSRIQMTGWSIVTSLFVTSAVISFVLFYLLSTKEKYKRHLARYQEFLGEYKELIKKYKKPGLYTLEKVEIKKRMDSLYDYLNFLKKEIKKEEVIVEKAEKEIGKKKK